MMSKDDLREPLLPKVGDGWTKPNEREPLLPKRDRPSWHDPSVNPTPDAVRWTNVPPTETGWYWWRVNNADDEPLAFSCYPPHAVVGHDVRVATDMRGEWWPVAIEPPNKGEAT